MIENFGRNVARLRKERGLTQEELAVKLDVKKQTISNIERGERYPTFENLEKISQVLNASAIQLFGTPNEITVSETPVILDRIDEYNGKVQAILKVEKLLEDKHFLKEVYGLAEAVQEITNFGMDKKTVRDIENINQMVWEIDKFANGGIMIDEYGEPELDKNLQPIREKGVLETFPFEKIEKARKDIEFILDNKDKI